jgi:hypothetical protein
MQKIETLAFKLLLYPRFIHVNYGRNTCQKSLRVPLVELLAAFAFVKSQQLNQRGWLPSKVTAKTSFCLVQT